MLHWKHRCTFRRRRQVNVNLAEWLRRMPAKCMGFPAQVRTLQLTKSFAILSSQNLAPGLAFFFLLLEPKHPRRQAMASGRDIVRRHRESNFAPATNQHC